MNDLTTTQYETYRIIKALTDKKGYSPTYKEIADYRGISSPRAVVDSVRILERKGYVSVNPRKSRSIVIIK